MPAIPALARFDAYASLAPGDLAALIKLAAPSRAFREGEQLYRQGEAGPRLVLLLEGWAASSVTLESGDRQLLKVLLPGDMVGLHTLPIGYASDGVTALTAGTACEVSPRALGRLFAESPRVAALLFLISQEERLMFMDRLTTIGRVDAVGRFAGFLVQLRARMLRSDPEVGAELHVPLTQSDFADLLGMTSVHMNRVMKELRERQVIRTAQRRITLLDLAELRRLAQLPERVLTRDQDWLPESRG